ncbi:MAG: UDP-3-O-(3-hydroxymyristoyl)glucosamine N-acyltransferase [Bdellovibrionaceae bacterium]|nr:UDP-3-O-(3-hydroxymyristoyl)glucosamine N-acyltransferase [Pseudobdellovibrionaceae bacterium]
MILAQDIVHQFRSLLEPWHGNPPPGTLKAAPVEDCGPGDLVFASKQEQLNQACEKQASVIVTSGKLTLPAGLSTETFVLKTAHVGLAMAQVLPLFDSKRSRWQFAGLHPMSSIHPTARLGKNVTVEAFVSIGENVQIADDCFIASNSVIERNAVLGEKCRIHPQVFIGSDSVLGRECEIHPHVTIGSDGFGYAQDASFQHHKLPQLGRVTIGDRVEIGAGTTIDRAAFTETKIGSGTKFDNLCHVAHNCEIGENGIMAGGFMVAGSAKIGARFMSGGSTVVADHVHITDGVILAGRSSVTGNVDKPGAYGGYPLVPMKEHLRTIASLPHVVRLRKQVSRILKHLNLQEEE